MPASNSGDAHHLLRMTCQLAPRLPASRRTHVNARAVLRKNVLWRPKKCRRNGLSSAACGRLPVPPRPAEPAPTFGYLPVAEVGTRVPSRARGKTDGIAVVGLQALVHRSQSSNHIQGGLVEFIDQVWTKDVC